MEKYEFYEVHTVLHRSLKQMAMIKYAVKVWNEAENLDSLNEVKYDDLIFPKKVKEKVPMYPIPKKMEQEFLETLELIAMQILKWKERHATVLPDPGIFLNKLCWTWIGTVDNCKTAKILIQQEEIDISDRYRLACMYCLENDIPLIWKKLAENDKEDFRERNKTCYFADREVAFWLHKLDHEENKPSGFCNIGMRSNCYNYQYAFETAVTSANKEAADYFLQRLTPDERTASLLSPGIFDPWRTQCTDVNLHKKVINFSDVVVYLLSQMNEEEQMGMFRLGTLPIMISFLEWPWHFLFKKVAKISLQYYLFATYRTMLTVVARGREIYGYYFTKLLEEFFQVSPDRLKLHFIDKSYDLRCHFFNSYNSNCINIILRNLEILNSAKEKLMTSMEGRRYCVKLIDQEEWILLELLIADCAFSEISMGRFKKSFMNSLFYARYIFLSSHKMNRDWRRFFEIIDNYKVEDCSKRNLEDMDDEDMDDEDMEDEDMEDEDMEDDEGSRKKLK